MVTKYWLALYDVDLLNDKILNSDIFLSTLLRDNRTTIIHHVFQPNLSFKSSHGR